MEMEIDEIVTEPYLYKLSESIKRTDKSLRSIAINQNGLICTGSFDNICALYQSTKEGSYTHMRDTFLHEDYIYVVRSEAHSKGFLTGSKDKKIIYMDNEGNPLGEYVSHDGVVNSISQNESDLNTFISGSWDGTAKIWDIEKQTVINSLEGHSHAVSVLSLGNNKYVTASQDKVLRFWHNNKEINSISEAHNDIIRSIILGPGKNSIFTCSNDGCIKEWSLLGQLLNTAQAHDAFVYSLFVNYKNNQIFSCSEDTLINSWKYNLNLIESIEHPNTVWECAVNPLNDDLLSVCSDGLLRVFSHDPNRILDKKSLEEYSNLCRMSKTQKEEGNEQNNDVDINKLMPIEQMFNITGAKEGEIKLFNNNGKGEAYMYKASENRWELIGEVMGKKKEKNYYEGDKQFPAGEYDYIFDVDLKGETMTKLPFNEGDNCLIVAEKFACREGLHKNYIDDIIKFLRANTGKRRPAKPTIEQRKTNDRSMQRKNNYNNNSKAANKPHSTMNFAFPDINFKFYDGANSEGPIKKITELNSKIEESSNNKKLSDSQLKHVINVIKILGDKTHYHCSQFEENDIKEFLDLIVSWHNEYLIPIFDCYRMYLMHPESNKLFKKSGGGIIELTAVLENLKSNKNANLSNLALRILCNHFNNDTCRAFIKLKRESVTDVLSDLLDCEDGKIRTVICYLLFNFSIAFNNADINDESIMPLLAQISEMISSENDPDNLITLLKALGNFFVTSASNREIGTQIGLLDIVKSIQSDNEYVNELKNYNITLLE